MSVADRRETVRTQLAAALRELAALDVTPSVDADDLDTLLDEFDEEFGLEYHLDRAGETYVAARIVFERLRQYDTALLTDTECIYGYDSYGDQLEAYAALTDGALAGVDYEISGDWSAGEDAAFAVELAGERVEATLSYGGDWMDLDLFLKVLNRLLRDATDEDRRFATVPLRTGQTAAVVFVTPEQSGTLETYFRDAAVSFDEYRS